MPADPHGRRQNGRGTQVVRERSAKPLCVGSIPTRASKPFLSDELDQWPSSSEERFYVTVARFQSFPIVLNRSGGGPNADANSPSVRRANTNFSRGPWALQRGAEETVNRIQSAGSEGFAVTTGRVVPGACVALGWWFLLETRPRSRANHPVL